MSIHVIGSKTQEKRLATLVGRIFHILQIPDAGIDIYCVSDARMRTLYRGTAGKDKVTNVLSFPEPKGFIDPEGGVHYLGELYLASAKIRNEARAMKISYHEWETKLLVHGILHLLGYDHIHDRDAARMEKKEKEILINIQGTPTNN
ncbi:MAG: rRNA maturation RNase YbeY [Patescibacteria group bacterium]|nr:rRNA maturation RNase YbeY [Patescibacteria group bacterium]MDE2438364.1 rRNA maturation RNase YbeY [Patescibacteria group bacterium]